jgi:murein endopeptidase
MQIPEMVRRRLLWAVSLLALAGLGVRAASGRADAPHQLDGAQTNFGGAPASPWGPFADDVGEDAEPPHAGIEDRDVARPAPERAFPFLDDEDRTASVSVGDTSYGWIANANKLVENDAVAILPRQRERDLAWGSEELVAMVQAAGASLLAATKTRLWVGNIGRRGGGDIPWSVSHNSGRDVDIALSYLDRQNKPVDPPDLVPLDHRGESRDKELRFDAARTWIVVRSLLEHPRAQVQFIFLSASLKRKLIEFATARRAPAEIIARAKEVIMQPGPPHDDHMHVRIYCGERDLGGGCVNTGVVRPWIRVDTQARVRRVEAARARLEATSVEARRAAILRLGLLDARELADAIGKRLGDADADVRAASASTLGALGTREHEGALVSAFLTESSPVVKVGMLGALGKLGGASSGRLFADIIGRAPLYCDEMVAAEEAPSGEGILRSDFTLAVSSIDAAEVLQSIAPVPSFLASVPCEDRTTHTALVRAAIDAAGYADRLEPVDPLLSALEQGEDGVRARAADALARITNRRFGERWDDVARPPQDREKDVRAWRKWVEMLRKTPRDAWVASGFVAAGYRVPRLDAQHAWELVRALPRGDHLAYNAHRALERIGGRRSRVRSWSDAAACSDWLGYFRQHRRTFRIEAPPKTTLEACRRPRD